MKYYSEKLNKFYDSAEACQKEEFEAKEKENLAKIKKEREEAEAKAKKEKAIAERKEAAGKVEAARKAYNEAQKAYRNELEGFCKKYGTYHYSTSSAEEIPSLFDWFDKLFRL